jgi:hydroxymethylpyrimidine pyrophosphatase-like HAD family hydrolase
MHYLVEPTEEYLAYYKKRGVPCKNADPAVHHGPFQKIGIYGDTEHREEGSANAARTAVFDRMEEELNRLLNGQLVVLRATPLIINIHAPGASKLSAARRVQRQLGKKHLVCVGDEGNDLDMLLGADFAFCPSDGAVADQFPNVCPCGDGAVADVIYHKIPEILKGE